MLSDEDHEILADGGWKNSRELANYAYALGVERARKVKPLAWTSRHERGASIHEAKSYAVIQDGESWICLNFRCLFGPPSFASAAEAKSACQQHHEEFVLSQLEQP